MAGVQQPRRWPLQRKMCCNTKTTRWGWRSSLEEPVSSPWPDQTALLLAVGVLHLFWANIWDFSRTWFKLGLHLCSVGPSCPPPARNQDWTGELKQRWNWCQWHSFRGGKGFYTCTFWGVCFWILHIWKSFFFLAGYAQQYLPGDSPLRMCHSCWQGCRGEVQVSESGGSGGDDDDDEGSKQCEHRCGFFHRGRQMTWRIFTAATSKRRLRTATKRWLTEHLKWGSWKKKYYYSISSWYDHIGTSCFFILFYCMLEQYYNYLCSDHCNKLFNWHNVLYNLYVSYNSAIRRVQFATTHVKPFLTAPCNSEHATVYNSHLV